jgi:hypothetical protein
MIFAVLVAASLTAPYVVPVSIDRAMPLESGREASLSLEQKDAAIRPLVSKATECIARTVSADPRLPAASGGTAFNSLIVESVPSCVDALRSMIDAFDRMFGDGAGESYFSGPYLDGLPDAVTQRVKRLR